MDNEFTFGFIKWLYPVIMSIISYLIVILYIRHKRQYIVSKAKINIFISTFTISFYYFIIIALWSEAPSEAATEYVSAFLLGLLGIYLIAVIIDLLRHQKNKREVYKIFNLKDPKESKFNSLLMQYEGQYEITCKRNSAIIEFRKIPHDTVKDMLEYIENQSDLYSNPNDKLNGFSSIIYLLIIIAVTTGFILGYVTPGYFYS